MKDTQITIRISSEFKKAVQEYAEETGRTFAGLVEYALRKEMKLNPDAAISK